MELSLFLRHTGEVKCISHFPIRTALGGRGSCIFPILQMRRLSFRIKVRTRLVESDRNPKKLVFSAQGDLWADVFDNLGVEWEGLAPGTPLLSVSL